MLAIQGLVPYGLKLDPAAGWLITPADCWKLKGRMTLKWNGKALLRDVLRAAVPAMDDTTRAVVQSAQGRVRRRTGNLADSIDSGSRGSRATR